MNKAMLLLALSAASASAQPADWRPTPLTGVTEPAEVIAHSAASDWRAIDPENLLVIDTTTDAVVGTYRLQTGERARERYGYYCEREFDLTPFAPHRAQVLELGRACVHVDHRSFAVLNALWRAIALYARQRGSRYLIGCSSLTSQDQSVGAASYLALQKHLAPEAFRTLPQPAYVCDMSVVAAKPPKIPKLLAAYLALGIKLCGPPAIDREFKTIDFLTLFDLEQIRMDGTSGWMRFEN